MTFGQIRLIKRVLLLLLVSSGAYVGYQVWRGISNRDKKPDTRSEGPRVGVSREVQLEELDSEGQTAWTLKAAESTGRSETKQNFRQVEIRFGAGKDKVPVVVTADRCEISKDRSVYLEGNVVVRDETTLRLESATLHFARNPDRVWTRDSVRYSRKGLSGTAGNMRYALDAGVLELGEQVAMTLQQKGEAPVAIQSLSAKMRRKLHMVRFIDAVHVRQVNRALDCNDLQIYLDENDEEMERMEAYENVDLRMNVASTSTEGPEEEPSGPMTTRTSLTTEPGTKRLLTDRFEAYLRPGGKVLERARALEGGRLIIRLPKGATSGLQKELEGYTLAFDFDEEGRLVTLRGRGGVTLTLVPVAAGAEKKTVTARQLEADFDPVTGELVEARCEQAVTFEQGAVHASAEKGTFRSSDSQLLLEDQPRLWDESASLEAKKIRIQVETGDVEGVGDVRSKSSGESDRTGFPGGEKAPVFFVSQHLLYERGQDRAAYSGDARAIQGRNRIEAERIAVIRGKGDLSAEGNVQTVLFQRVKSHATATATGTGTGSETRTETKDTSTSTSTATGTDTRMSQTMTTTEAQRLDYHSDESILHYVGEVAMRSEDMTLRGDTIDVALTPGGNEVNEVRATGKVAIETTDGTAAGDTAKYLPKDGSMTVTGDDASLSNAGKVTEGKQLTFFLDDDKVFVDGRELTRTKTTYSSKPRL